MSTGSARPGPARTRRRRLAWLGVCGLLTVVPAAAVFFVALPDREGVTRAATGAKRHAQAPRTRAARRHALAPQRGRPTVVATVASGTTGLSVPRSFFGISTEYWSLPGYESDMSAFGRVLSQLHAPGDGPFVLRVGGNSADHTVWEPAVRSMPRWVFQLTPAWLRAARALVQLARVRLILDLNLVTGSPLVAAQWARAAEADLPRRSIIGFEIGNEPDIYSRLFWLARMARTSPETTILPRDLTAADYVRDLRTYSRLLGTVAPGVPLLAPALANPSRHLSWISTVVARASGELGSITAHRYPYSACVSPTSQTFPTIPRLLGEQASAGIARSVAPAVAIAHRAGLPLRLTELNSVTCGGVAGVSDTFATALWAPDALFELLHAGVDGVSVHVRTDAINAAFVLTRRGLVARPLLYGLILFSRMLGPGAQLVPVRLSAGSASHLKLWAVRVAGGRLHVLVIDKGTSPATIDLRVAADGPATVARLLAPSVAATSRVTLAGRSLGRDGRWKGRRSAEMIAPAGNGYRFTVGRFSATLLTIPNAPRISARPIT